MQQTLKKILSKTALCMFWTLLVSCERKQGSPTEVTDPTRQSLAEIIKIYDNLSTDARANLVQNRQFTKSLTSIRNTLESYSRTPIQIGPRDLCHIAVPLSLVPSDKPIVDDCQFDLSRGSNVIPILASALHKKFPESDLVLLNAGSTMSGLKKGPIYWSQFSRILPHRDQLVTIEVLADDLASSLGLFHKKLQTNLKLSGFYPYFSGLRYNLDLTNPGNPKVAQLELFDSKTNSWKAVQSDEKLRVLTFDYVASDTSSPFKTLGRKIDSSNENMKSDPRLILFETLQIPISQLLISEHGLQKISR